jgi:iron complex transport system ATP-binding protein
MMAASRRLSVTGLTFHRGRRCILDSISAQFEPGSVIAVLGPNGVGKSTLLECMAGLLKPLRGEARLDGVPVTAIPAAERARHIAFQPQIPEIAWPVDVATLVGLARVPFRGIASVADDQAAVARALHDTGTAQWSERVVTTLSGGERARVLLARVFAGDPAWILADEPFTGLDPAHQFEAADLLRKFAARGGGVLLTIHDLGLAARIADRIVILHDGRIVAEGPPQAALTPSTLREVYGIDAQWVAIRERGAPLIAIHGRHAG